LEVRIVPLGKHGRKIIGRGHKGHFWDIISHPLKGVRGYKTHSLWYFCIFLLVYYSSKYRFF
jgi:hypothetical protein